MWHITSDTGNVRIKLRVGKSHDLLRQDITKPQSREAKVFKVSIWYDICQRVHNCDADSPAKFQNDVSNIDCNIADTRFSRHCCKCSMGDFKHPWTHFICSLSTDQPNLGKIHYALACKIMIQPDHKSSHVTTAQLSWHMHNCDLIWSFATILGKEKFHRQTSNLRHLRRH